MAPSYSSVIYWSAFNRRQENSGRSLNACHYSRLSFKRFQVQALVQNLELELGSCIEHFVELWARGIVLLGSG